MRQGEGRREKGKRELSLFVKKLFQVVRNLSPFYFLLFPFSLAAQSSDKRAQQAYDRGVERLTARKPEEAFGEFQKAIERDPDFGEAYFRLGQLAEIQRQPARVAELYEKALQLRPESPTVVPAYGWLGSYALRQGRYAQAATYLQRLQALAPPTGVAATRLKRQLATADFAQRALKNPTPLRVRKLPDGVNAFDSQYFPVLTADGETLIFTAIAQENGDENLYVTRRTGEGWSAPESLSSVINSPENEGTCAVSADGRTLVFTSCQGRKRRGFGNCDLYVSYQTGNDWSEPENLGKEINSGAWESQPALSPDGRTLYFVSDRPGGIGRRDLWRSQRDSLGRWTAAENLGKGINTPDDEVSPFLHANGRTLFFASDGYVGMGGLDVWMSEWDGKTWSTPENLGYPLNTHEDQVALFISADGTKGYYSVEESGAQRERRKAVLAEFEVPPTLATRFKRANVIKGRVVDAKTGQPLTATLELVNLGTNRPEAQVQSDAATGEFTATLTDGGQYGVFVNRPGYFYKSLTFDYSQDHESGTQRLDVRLEPLRKEAREVLNNLFFATGAYTLQEKSTPELDKLVRLLRENPALRLEIAGHTDDVGDDRRNLDLSLKRAGSVTEYLAAHGIAAERIRSQGYGETRPVVPNTSDENRARNRRIEVTIQ
jgi:outer membrane protein OmpA-like peptidoglycan-associated protein/tetratricopeptide (TPR) repeat protein